MSLFTQNDFLFVFTLGHGFMDSTLTHGALQLNDTIMLDTEFSQLVNAIPANKRVIWMQNSSDGDLLTALFETMMNPVSRIQF